MTSGLQSVPSDSRTKFVDKTLDGKEINNMQTHFLL